LKTQNSGKTILIIKLSKMKTSLKIILTATGIVINVFVIIGFLKEYGLDINEILAQLNDVNYKLKGQIIIFSGSLTIIAFIIIFGFITLIVPKAPRRSVVDLVTPFLLHKDELEPSDYNIQRLGYVLVIIAIIITVSGLFLVFGPKLFPLIFS